MPLLSETWRMEWTRLLLLGRSSQSWMPSSATQRSMYLFSRSARRTLMGSWRPTLIRLLMLRGNKRDWRRGSCPCHRCCCTRARRRRRPRWRCFSPVSWLPCPPPGTRAHTSGIRGWESYGSSSPLMEWMELWELGFWTGDFGRITWWGREEEVVKWKLIIYTKNT